jgi:hypothetical protein
MIMRTYLLLLNIIIASVSYGGNHEYAGPTSLGPYKIEDEISIKIFNQFIKSQIISNGAYSCYKSVDEEYYLWAVRMAHEPRLIGGVLISSFPNCRGKTINKVSVSFSTWKTERGIGLGSTMNEVKKAYGIPFEQNTVEGSSFSWVIRGEESDNYKKLVGNMVLTYRSNEDDLRVACFGIRDHKVVWIFLSNNE